MAEQLEATGKTVEEALEIALARLGRTADEVDYTVLEQPSKGLFGLFGAKKAKIRVEVKQSVLAAENPATIVKEELAPDIEAVKAAETEVTAVAETEEMAEDAVAEANVREEELQDRAEKFLHDVFAAMKIEVKIQRKETEEGLVFELIGEDLGILIGKHGQTLDSLQYLANLAANRGVHEKRVRVLIDIENYRARREETLVRLANHLAEKACRTGQEVHLEPMNRHERKIIHVALQDSHKVTTFSAGEEPRRYVVIAPKRRRRYYRGDRTARQERPARFERPEEE